MRVAAIYDVHGNLPALEAVLDDIRQAGADLIVVGGDVIPGPMPVQAIDALLALDLPVRFIRGNGDREVLAQRAGQVTGTAPEKFRAVMGWVAEQLTDAQAERLATWPLTETVEIPGLGRVLFCHATPRSDTEIFTRQTPEERLLPLFEQLEVEMVVCGHTHMQFDRRVGGVRVVNAGSVGMPFGEPGACWLLLGPEVSLRRTSYDLQAAAERIRASGYPQAEQFAQENVLRPPSEAEMLALFERSALR